MNSRKRIRKSKTEPNDKKRRPLSEELNKDAVRTLVYNGAIFRARLTDDQYKQILEKGKLGKDFEIKRRSMVSNPVIIAKVEFEGMKDIEIELEISGDSFRASKTLATAGVPEDLVTKVGQIEFALKAGEHELVDDILGIKDEFDGFMGSIEGAIARAGKKDKSEK